MNIKVYSGDDYTRLMPAADSFWCDLHFDFLN